jgi:hypothetical protein
MLADARQQVPPGPLWAYVIKHDASSAAATAIARVCSVGSVTIRPIACQ